MAARRVTRKAVSEVKNKWFQEWWEGCVKVRLEEEETYANGDCEGWDGRSCSTHDSQQQKWRRHFIKVLSIESVFSDSEVESVRQRPVREKMAEAPSEEEQLEPVMKLKSEKAAVESVILPEMVKVMCCEGDCAEMLVELVRDVWAEGCVPVDWM